MDAQQAKSIIEALLFASEKPLSLKRLQKILAPCPRARIERHIGELQAEYQLSGRGIQLVKVAGGYQLTTKPHLAEWVRRLFREKEQRGLSAPALETLAIIAYKQPVARAEVEAIRGVDSSGVLHSLLEKNLIDITGRAEGPGRPLLYGTSEQFLLYFGLDSLRDLPGLQELTDSGQKELPED